TELHLLLPKVPARIRMIVCRSARYTAAQKGSLMKMTAAVLYQQGLPRPYAESRPLRVETVELDGPGEGEVLVKVAGAGLCHSDLSTIDNSRPRTLPTIPGHEGAGIVAEVGANVRDLTAGDHVVFVFVPSCGECRKLPARPPQRLYGLAAAARPRRADD